ncbi:MAG: hypothetical protein V9G13_12020 [Marmoricola sp.]
METRISAIDEEVDGILPPALARWALTRDRVNLDGNVVIDVSK